MVIIETPMFTKQLTGLLSDDEYGAFQRTLIADPSAGAVIKDTGGLRKARVAASGKGKRGGARVIYYWITAASQIVMLTIYAKGEADDLSNDDKTKLRRIIENWK